MRIVKARTRTRMSMAGMDSASPWSLVSIVIDIGPGFNGEDGGLTCMKRISTLASHYLYYFLIICRYMQYVCLLYSGHNYVQSNN